MISWPSKSTLKRLLDLAGLHYTTSERSSSFWQSMLHNFLSRPLSFLDWTPAMLFWLDFHQTQSNLYKWFRMRRHDLSSTSPREPMLHLSLSPCTGYQLQLASSSRRWCLHIEQPQAQHPPTSTHWWQSTSPPEVWDLLVSDARGTITERLKITHQNILVHRSWLVEWSSHPRPERWIPVNLQATTENSSLSTLLDFILKKKKTLLSLYLSLLPLLACTYLNNVWDLFTMKQSLCVCLFKMNCFMYSFGLCIALDKSVCKIIKCKCN